tara:strand:+ start:5896 stop:6399 length:504 start_codon:yes stop_codon:yes gene_type:complete
MEKRINSKHRIYLQTFKDNIKNFISNTNCDDDSQNQILQFIYDYQPLHFDKCDFKKRKRVKNVVPFFERCCALRANKEQCTRRRKDGERFCGTHIKGVPHGEINQETEKPTHTKKVVRAQDIKGIIYYIDDDGNVYEPHDVMNNIINPKIIAKYVEKDGKYSIPSLF